MKANKLIAAATIIIILLMNITLVYAPLYMYECYNTGDDDSTYFAGVRWLGESFTVGGSAHNVSVIKLKLYIIGSPGDINVSIRATSGYLPTGNDLTSGIIDGNSLTTDTAGLWYEIAVPMYQLTASTKYAIIARAIAGSVGNRVYWRYATSGTYSGDSLASTNSGSTWDYDPYVDFMFEIWNDDPSGLISGYSQILPYMGAGLAIGMIFFVFAVAKAKSKGEGGIPIGLIILPLMFMFGLFLLYFYMYYIGKFAGI